MTQELPVRRFDLGQIRLLLPILIPVLVLSVVPLVQGIYLGFTDYRLGEPVEFNGLDNYRYMVGDRFFWQSFRIGAVWTLAVTAGQIVLGLGLASLLSLKLRFTSMASVLILVPWAMPPVIRGIMWRGLYGTETGIINHWLMTLGVLDMPIDWLNSFTYTVPAIIVVGIWGELPKTAVFLLAALLAIPTELYEAARLDGANAWQIFRGITLPMIGPVLAVVTALAFTWNFNTFGLVWVLTQGGPGGLTRLPMLAAYEEGFRYGNVGYAAAIGNVMILLIGAVLFFYLRRQLRERV